MSDPNARKAHDIRTYVVGYASALMLTAVAFAAVRWPSFDGGGTLVIVLSLALIQLVVHFRCFLHVTLARSARDSLQLILFSSLIVALMVSGTLVILLNLRGRMM